MMVMAAVIMVIRVMRMKVGMMEWIIRTIMNLDETMNILLFKDTAPKEIKTVSLLDGLLILMARQMTVMEMMIMTEH